jgi:hypothetical protein
MFSYILLTVAGIEEKRLKTGVEKFKAFKLLKNKNLILKLLKF